MFVQDGSLLDRASVREIPAHSLNHLKFIPPMLFSTYSINKMSNKLLLLSNKYNSNL